MKRFHSLIASGLSPFSEASLGMVITELLVSVPAFNLAVTSSGELSGVVSNAKSLPPIATTSSPLQDPEYLRPSLGSGGPFFIISLLISSSVLPLTAYVFVVVLPRLAIMWETVRRYRVVRQA